MREDGFYWVKIHQEWVIGKYYKFQDKWSLPTLTSLILRDSDFEEIDERQIKRDESKNA